MISPLRLSSRRRDLLLVTHAMWQTSNKPLGLPLKWVLTHFITL